MHRGKGKNEIESAIDGDSGTGDGWGWRCYWAAGASFFLYLLDLRAPLETKVVLWHARAFVSYFILFFSQALFTNFLT